MVELAATTRRHDGVTFVEATLSHEGPDPRQVTVENRLDGPVWPPRREGVPAAGWDPEAGTVTLTLDPGDRVGVGFATPADPADPPVSVVASGRPDDGRSIGDSAAAVVRALGDPSPPADAVPGPGSDRRASERSGTHPTSQPAVTGSSGESGGGGRPSSPADGHEGSPDGREVPETSPEVDPPRHAGAGRREDGDGESVGGYPAATAWLDAVQRRVETPTPETVDRTADARRLRRVATRAVELAERIDRPRGKVADQRGTAPVAGRPGQSPTPNRPGTGSRDREGDR